MHVRPLVIEDFVFFPRVQGTRGGNYAGLRVQTDDECGAMNNIQVQFEI